MTAYNKIKPALYNEIEPYAAQWLRNLIAAGHIAPGDVDERSITDVTPDDLRGYTQFHTFAGVGVWSYALRLAGWPDDRPVWTGSCPCQPFSSAGKGGGFDDQRHLWPYWHHLIRVCRPPVVFGEQVASKDGLGWLDLVSPDMEGEGYAFGAQDRCSAGVGAPHIRQRLYFVGTQGLQHAQGDGRLERWAEPGGRRASGGRRVDGMADLSSFDFRPGLRHSGSDGLRRDQPANCGAVGDLEHPDISVPCKEREQRGGQLGWLGRDQSPSPTSPHGPGPVNGPWANADWLFCRDAKWRPVESGTFPLAHGATSRVGRLRAYGNAIDAENARDFIDTFLEAESQGFADPRNPGLIDDEDLLGSI